MSDSDMSCIQLVVSVVVLIVTIALILAVFRIAKATERTADLMEIISGYIVRVDSNVQTIRTVTARPAPDEGIEHLTVACRCGGIGDVSADGSRAKCRACGKVWVI